MEISILLIKQIAQLFLMIAMGYIIVRAGILKEKDSKTISAMVLYLVVPCVIINAFQVDLTADIMQGLKLAAAAALILQIGLLLVAMGLKKIFHLNNVEMACSYYSNAGNLIIPIVTYILGAEWVIYACAFMCIQLIFFWTHCKAVISGDTTVDIKKILLNVNIISVFVGFLLFIMQIKLPEILQMTASSVGGMLGPLCMIVTGMLVAGTDLKQVFTNKKVYFIVFLRLIFMGIVSLAFLKLSGLVTWSSNGDKILLISFLAAIAPVASTVTQMCQVYGNDSKYANAINIMSTLLCIITMPLMVLVYQAVI